MPVIVSSTRSRVASSHGIKTDSDPALAAASGSPVLPGNVSAWTPILSRARSPEIFPPTTPIEPTMLVASAYTTAPDEAR